MKQREIFFLFLGFTLGSLVGFIAGIAPSLSKENNAHFHGQESGMPRMKAPESPVEILEKELKKNPDSYEILLKLAKEYHQRENFRDAAIYYEKALKISNQDAIVLCDYGMVLEELGQWNDAIAQWEKAKELSPSAWQPLYCLIRAKAVKKNAVEDVRKEYESLKQKEPKNIEIPLGLGVVYAQAENFPEALFYFQESLGIEPENLQTLSYMARCYEKNKQPKEAAKFYEKLLEQLPKGHRTEMLRKKIEDLKKE